MIEATPCDQARSWLHELMRRPDFPPPVSALHSHVTTCATCQGALATLVVAMMDPPSACAGILCEQCLAAVPRLVDQNQREQELGDRAVWLHLRTCPDCAAVYDMTVAFVQAEERGDIAPPPPFAPQPEPAPAKRELLHLTRAFLNLALPAPVAVAGATRSGVRTPSVVVDEELGGSHEIVVRVQEQRDGNWRVLVTVKPSPIGWLVLLCGVGRFRERFDAHGNAQIDDVPAALLTSPDGPDVSLVLELDPPQE